jgi:hypothetical protein
LSTPQSTLPEPVGSDSRTCFGIKYFATEADAETFAAAIKGQTYNGGFFHGMACGRDRSFDRTVDGARQYAVTVA